MNSDQLRELADILEQMAAAPVFDRLDIPGAVALLRQCAEQRPCTCHPDDNPPVPCARKYALSECREAPQREPLSEEQIMSIEKQANARYDANGRLVRWAVVFARAVERAHGIAAKEQAMSDQLPPLPEWLKMDNLGGLVPSEVRVALCAYARAAQAMAYKRLLVDLGVYLENERRKHQHRSATEHEYGIEAGFALCIEEVRRALARGAK